MYFACVVHVLTEIVTFIVVLLGTASTREPPTFAEESACTLLVGLSANWPTYVFEENEASDRLSPRGKPAFAVSLSSLFLALW